MVENNIVKSAGFVIIQNNKILLEHPTGNLWYNSFSIPKGHVEPGEGYLEAAIRETKEEIGIKIDPKEIISGPHIINYVNKNNEIFKKNYLLCCSSRGSYNRI